MAESCTSSLLAFSSAKKKQFRLQEGFVMQDMDEEGFQRAFHLPGPDNTLRLYRQHRP